MEIQAARKAGGPEEAKAKAKELRASNRIKIRSLLTVEQRKKYEQMEQGRESESAPSPIYKVWTPVPEGRPIPVEITTGISDGSFVEVTGGALREEQEVIVDTLAGNNKAATTTSPSMRGFR
jgi:multidrug efflux pump subunit AcrA (membrane-fusion protein)